MGNVDVVRELYERWAVGDFRTPGFFDPDVEFSRRGAGLGVLVGEWRGVDAMWGAMADYIRAFDDMRMEIDELIEVDADRILALDRHMARGRASTARVEHELASLFTLRDGVIVRLVGYWDRADALRDAGLDPDRRLEP
jgi:ketosteroid isomerase-like protein